MAGRDRTRDLFDLAMLLERYAMDVGSVTALPVRDEAAHLLVAAGGRAARRFRLREGEELDAQGAVEAPPDDRGAQDVRARIGLMGWRTAARRMLRNDESRLAPPPCQYSIRRRSSVG